MTVIGAHLVGSVPLTDATAVFTEASRVLGTHLNRIPDGETGPRTNWVGWQLPLLMDNPALEVTEADGDYGTGVRMRVRTDASADIGFGPLGYADAAIASFRVFDTLQKDGIVSDRAAFQVCLPTPAAPVHLWVRTEDQEVVEGAYEAEMLAELDVILAEIPHERLAIQWDTAVEFGILEGVFPTFLTDPMQGIIERLLRLGDAIPEDVQLGYHLCYGDAGHRHFVEPRDTALLVAVSNAIVNGLGRSIDWLHLPVPRDRADDAYFAPLGSLALNDATELYLGLVHAHDGVDGARKRIAAAARCARDFGIATECGLGRRDPASIPELLEIHAQVALPHTRPRADVPS